jgi:aspartate carbamoyltransferase
MKQSNLIYGSDIISIDQFDPEAIELVMKTAAEMETMVKSHGGSDILKGKMMTALFYEPSSRTFGSFVASMTRLGGGVIPLQGVTYSSVAKGETLADTVRTFSSYSDVVVIRHPEVGSARMAADFSEKPIINAGDGVGEHPTQALLDLYTIKKRLGGIENLTITMVGDLVNGRTVHSLSKLLSLQHGITLHLVSPDILNMPTHLVDVLTKRGVKVHQHETLEGVLSETDVLYVTRIQKERFSDLDTYEKLKHHYVITSQTMKKLKKTGIVMHPFPRVGEIAMEVDLDTRAAYITDQMPNGMYVRMALLRLVLAK